MLARIWFVLLLALVVCYLAKLLKSVYWRLDRAEKPWFFVMVAVLIMGLAPAVGMIITGEI